MHEATHIRWKSALLAGWIVGLAASAGAQPPGSAGEEPKQTSLLLAELSLPAAPAAPRELVSVPLDARLAELEDLLARAYFSEVADAAKQLRANASLSASSPQQRVRFEVSAATAHVALGALSPAVSCFKRALQAWPELELPRTTSPKVLHAFVTAQRELERDRGDRSEARELGEGRSVPARLIEGAPPRRPASSGALRPTILCRIEIDAHGAVVNASVQRPRHDLAAFEELALASVRRYRFEPARRDGLPVSSWLNWPVQF